MEKEITTKFSSCFVDVYDTATILGPDKKVLMVVKFKSLPYGEFLSKGNNKVGDLVFDSIVEWDLGKGFVKPSKQEFDNLRTPIVGYLIVAFNQLNLVSETEEKNLERQ